MKKFTSFILCLLLTTLSIQAQNTATLTFDDKAKRTVFDTLQQVWTENGIIFTNNKSEATSDVADYANPVRLYKGSEVIVEFPSPIIKIEFECSTAKYAQALNNSISNSTLSEKTVTMELDGTSNSFTCSLTDAQVRLKAVTVTYTNEGNNSIPSAHKSYTVVAEGHSSGKRPQWAINDEGTQFVSTINTSIATEAQKQFAFITYNDALYIYSISAKKFVMKNASLSDNTPDAVEMTDLGNDKFFFKFDNRHNINISDFLIIDSCNCVDGGNQFTLIEAGDFDATEALALLGGTSEPEPEFDESEWAILQSITASLISKGWDEPWDLSKGIDCVHTLPGLTIKNGHIEEIDLSNSDLHGEFPIELLQLPKLKVINLENNHLTGNAENIAAYMSGTVFPNITSINISNNEITGNIGYFATVFPGLKSLIASYNKLEAVYPQISPTVTELNLNNQNIDHTLYVHLNNLSAEAIAANIPSIIMYNHTAQNYNSNIELVCTHYESNWVIILSHYDGIISIRPAMNQNIYYGKNDDRLNVSVSGVDCVSEGSQFTMSMHFDLGDANFDGKSDILDVQSVINFIFNSYGHAPYNFTASNLWEDDIINIQDLICLVNKLILTEPTESTTAMRAPHNRNTESSINDAEIYVEKGKLIINTTTPVAAFDIIVEGARKENIVTLLEQNGFTCETRDLGTGTRIIAYSLSGAQIPLGENVIAVFDTENAIVKYAKLSDIEAKAIGAQLNGQTTSINEIYKAVQSDSEIYDIQGRKVKSPLPNGLYIKNGRKVIR